MKESKELFKKNEIKKIDRIKGGGSDEPIDKNKQKKMK